LFIRKLVLKDFRNYKYQTVAFNDGTALLYGGNAQGKTNALEAIFLLSLGRSHRNARDKDLININADFARVYAEVQCRDGIHTIEIILCRGEKKRILINGLPASKTGELMGHLCTVIFSPEDLSLVKSGPAERRRFMDLEISQYNKEYYYNLQKYNKILDERNALLKSISKNPELISTLDIWNNELCSTAAAIIETRNGFCKKLAPAASGICDAISGGSEKLTVIYNKSAKGEKREEIYFNLLEKLKSNLKEDIDKGNTGIGPHREDIIVKINDADLRAFASQGQQRTAALSLKLAQVDILKSETGENPVLLLDDVLSELDHDRQRFLLASLKSMQTIVTCTGIDSSLFDAASLFLVKAGKITKEDSSSS